MHLDWTCTILGLVAALASMFGAWAAAWVAVITIREHRVLVGNVIDLVSSNAQIMRMLVKDDPGQTKPGRGSGGGDSASPDP